MNVFVLENVVQFESLNPEIVLNGYKNPSGKIFWGTERRSLEGGRRWFLSPSLWL